MLRLLRHAPQILTASRKGLLVSLVPGSGAQGSWEIRAELTPSLPSHSHLGSVPPCGVCRQPPWDKLLRLSALQPTIVDIDAEFPIAGAFRVPGSGQQVPSISSLTSPSDRLL